MVCCHACAAYFFEFVINTTAYHFGRYSLHLLLLKSSMNKPALGKSLLKNAQFSINSFHSFSLSLSLSLSLLSISLSLSMTNFSFLNGHYPASFSYIFVFPTVNSKYAHDKILPNTRFEPRISGIGSDRSDNRAAANPFLFL